MKRSLTFVCILASGFSVSALAQASAASPMPSAPVPASSAVPAAGPAKIAIIQFQQAVAATNEGQRDFAELRKKFEPKQTQLKALSDEIDGLKKQLQSPTATEATKATLTRQIDEKTKSLQRQGEDAQNDFQQETGETYQKLAEKVYQIVQTYAAQSGYTLVLDASAQQSPVLWANQGTDISQAVVEAYNQKSGVPAQANSTPTSTTPRSTAPARTPSTTKPATSPQ
ncbi:Outer membrane protein H precursor [Acidisarcina polymorpha]|uniref:Outer membrane protein H n=1 Tax=Acidisarcina polymorpha TaxID=2211140 RepID=A0A2Z5FXA0_9BACT|nr:OmpH family outer membrane protein [Acidisarcina polymorpha]AXC11117.1 Outer membrane protein H precursor [Acidisarcina polymorpha]